MIANLGEAGVAEALEAAVELPAGPEVLQRLRDGEEPFVVVPGRAGLEWGIANRVKGAPNRARLKLFVPSGRDDLVVLFAYKVSQVPWSEDRYAYGVWEIPVEAGEARLDPDELERWIEFQRSGFHPERRPNSLVRQIAYDVPI